MTIAINRGRSAAFGSFTTALLASAAYFTLGVAPASATCVATGPASYDACASAAAWALDPNITLSGAGGHDGFVPANIGATPGTLVILSGGNLINFPGGFFNTGVALTVNAGGSITLDGTDATGLFGIDTFASLAGAGTINLSVAGTNGMFFGGNNANTAFSGTVNAPSLNNFLRKIGTGTFTVNGMTMAEGELIDGGTGGGLIQSGGTSNIKSIAVGSGTGASNTMTMSGGVLNITGTIGAVPCASNCPALRVGDFAGVGVLNHTGGTIVVGAAGVAGSMNIGNQGGTGTYNISAGTLQLGVSGDVNSAGLYAIGRQASGNPAFANSTGVLNISGTGLVDVQAGELINADRDAGGAVGAITSSTINMTGGTLRIRPGSNLWLSGMNNANAVDSVFNLNGGTLEVGDGRLQSNYGGGGGAYQFNLGNGTIRVIDTALVTSVDGILTGGTAATGVKIDTNGIGATWNGVLSGTGWLVKTGAGTLNLGGVNTYTGGTAFNGGTVLVDAVSDLGATTAGMSFNGGTLQLGANAVLTSRTGATSMAGAGTIDTNGFSSIYDGNISGSGTLTKIGAGTLDMGGNNNAHTGALNINGGLLLANFGNAIGNTSAVNVAAGAFLTVNASETIGSLAGAGQVSISPGVTMTTGGNNASTTWTGTMVGAGGALTKTGTGTFTINGNTNYTGLTTVSAGELRVNGTMADSLLIQAGARFSGNATISGNVTNSGAINPGNSPGSVIIAGNYIGGGVLNAEVQLNNAGAPVNGTTHDFLSIAGNASGTTLINVIPFAPSGAPAATTGNGVELVRVGGTTGAGQFALAAPVFAGAYEYTLNYLPNYSGANDGYFLQSRIGEGLFGDAAMAVAGKALMSNCFRSTDELLGDGERSTMGRAWAKVSGGNMSTGADTGLETDQDYTCGSGGMDLRVADGFRVGVSGGYANTDGDVSTLAGTGKLEGDGGMMSTHVGYASGNMFANVSLGYGNINWVYQGPLTAERTATTSGVIGAVQAGMLWPMGDWRLGATAELAYDGLECGNHCMVAGTQDDIANWTAKAGLRLDGTMHEGKILPFVSVAFSDSLDGSNSVSNGTAVLETESQSSLLNARAGVTAMIAENTAIFLSGGITEGMSNDVSGAEGTIGAKLHW
jgi:fibronectin-binding autotransporter adhesin